MWLVGVVVRRYIDILIIIINFPYSTCIRSFFGSSILTVLTRIISSIEILQSLIFEVRYQSEKNVEMMDLEHLTPYDNLNVNILSSVNN